MGTAVRLNVYDLLEFNKHTHCVGLGVYHSGVEVYGREYAYGGHEFSTSGVFETPPRMVPGGARFRESVDVGKTNMTAKEVEDLLKKLSREYLGDRYHLLYRNCNHFCDELINLLTGRKPPNWVNRLAYMAKVVYTVAPCVLPVSIRTIAKQPVMPSLGDRNQDNLPLLSHQPPSAALMKKPPLSAPKQEAMDNGNQV